MITLRLGLVNHVESDLLAAGGGPAVKCLGDGMLLEFVTRARRWRRRSRSDTPLRPELRCACRAAHAATHPIEISDVIINPVTCTATAST